MWSHHIHAIVNVDIALILMATWLSQSCSSMIHAVLMVYIRHFFAMYLGIVVTIHIGYCVSHGPRIQVFLQENLFLLSLLLELLLQIMTCLCSSAIAREIN